MSAPSPPAASSKFLSSLVVRDDDGFPFTLVEPLIYASALLRRTLTIPVGFRTDYASIPKGLWNILPKVGKYDRAAVVHDFLYQFNGCTRNEADGVLNEAMGVLGVPSWRRKLIYLGVRVGGSWTWKRYRGKAKA